MNNFIFKSSKGLIKNSSESLGNRLDMILAEQRHQRSDLQDVLKMIQKLLIDKHLQMQVDEYFQDNPQNIPEEKQDLD